MDFGGFLHLSEQFDKVTDFMLNPEHRNKTFSQLRQEFESAGGKCIGAGKFGMVFDHPSWKYVLKLFPHDDCYVRFVRYAYSRPHPSFPKFYGPPQRVVPFFRRDKSWSLLYLVRMERLFPVQDKQMLDWIVTVADGARWYFDADKHNSQSSAIYKSIDKLIQKYPQTKTLLQGWTILDRIQFQCAADIHEGNVMQRQNGELVWIDPLWYGSSPYADAREAERREIGGDNYDEPEQPEIPGGKLAPRPWRKKPKKSVYQGDPDIPF